MSDKDFICMQCGKPSVDPILYCSEECAIEADSDVVFSDIEEGLIGVRNYE